MLKDIRLHINKDERKQEQLEAKLATSLQTIYQANLNAFQRYIPSLVNYLSQPSSQSISIFCNKFGHFNIVDYDKGRVLYGANPRKSVHKQVQSFLRHGHYVNVSDLHKTDTTIEAQADPKLLEALPNLKTHLEYPAVPEDIECVVILGLGLGYHIKEVIDACSARYVIIYEPQSQYFAASTRAFNWKEVLEYAKKLGISLFFMLEKDGRNIVEDIEELKTHANIDSFYLYKHYNHPIFNSIHQHLMTHTWQQVKESGFHFDLKEDPNHYTHIFSEVASFEQYKNVSTDSVFFKKNITAFKRYFPDIAKQFENYLPRVWLPVETQDGQINMVNKDNLVSWHGDNPKQDGEQNFTGFSEHPNKDGLVLGYEGKKLAHYLHYQFVKETDAILNSTENEDGELPENIQSIIMFGLGVGYQLESLTKKHTLEKLFLCEPNPDFFYASLFAIDWQKIFQSIDEEKGKLYINIGDDGTNLFRDLLNQFYAVGPYILNNTYFYQSYYNASLNLAISKLREQLQIVISMGEYFDHAYHGIAQTKYGLQKQIPCLIDTPQQALTFADRDVPVFLVGNGPSLDQSLSLIEEWQDKAIIVSCGTALQVMHRNGIVPDFHAEIEQNRTSFDWACMIGDFDYLKKISLVSCNGVHPDTTSLYKDVYLAFKDGESSTVSSLQVIGEQDFSVLQFSFPTVANFATNLFTTLGFRNIYFIGIDMGFIDDKQHHSQQSAYYHDNGEELYDYTKSNNTALMVPGNFRQMVYTKHEFKVAKLVLEQTISSTAKDVNFFNCSDGAKIVGASPLVADHVLITSSFQEKQQAVIAIKNEQFKVVNGEAFIDGYMRRYSTKLVANELDVFGTLINHPVKSIQEAEALVEQQRNLLFQSYKNGKSLLFYYLYGTVNFANAMLTKLLYCSKEKGLEKFCEGLSIWQKYFEQFKIRILEQPNPYDVSTSPNDLLQRSYNVMQHHYSGKRLAFVTNSSGFVEAINYYINNALKLHDTVIAFLTVKDLAELQSKKDAFDYVIYHFVAEYESPDMDTVSKTINSMKLVGKTGTVLVDYKFTRKELVALHQGWKGNLTVLKIARDPRKFENPMWLSDLSRTALGTLFCAIENHYHVVFAKYPVTSVCDIDEFSDAMAFEVEKEDRIFSHYRHICIDFSGAKSSTGMMAVGDRGIQIHSLSDTNIFIAFEMSCEQFHSSYLKISEIFPKVIKDSPFE